MKVSLVSLTQSMIEGIDSAEGIITYCARVSNPSNQMSTDTAPKLLKYCIREGHWSIFEQASMCVEIETSRGIAPQIIRHKSMSIQEFSQRYQTVNALQNTQEPLELRMSGATNRQSSLECEDVDLKEQLNDIASESIKKSVEAYDQLIALGVAPESARFVLPLNTKTRMYLNGSVRSWIHYLQVRDDEHTQKEHRQIAQEIKKIFIKNFPNISEALGYL